MSDKDTDTKHAINHPAMRDGEIVDWKAILEKYEAEIKKLKTENKDYEAENKELKTENKKLKTETKKLKTETKKLKMENKEYETEIKGWKEETKKLMMEKKETEAEQEKLSFKKLITAPPQVLLVPAASTSSSVGSNTYKKAIIKEVPFEFALKSKTNLNGTKSFELDNRLVEQSKHCQSTLLLHFAKQNKVEQNITYSYCSEADISSLIQGAIEDATFLARCKTGRIFVTRHEYSIFSLRPDHFVILEDNVPLLAVEDKKPWNTEEENEMQRDLGHAYGQLYDYAKLMRASSTRASFLVFTCFKESRVLWLDSNQSNAIACNKDGVRDKFFEMSPPTSSKQQKENTPSPLNVMSPNHNVIKTLSKPQVQSCFRSNNKKRVLNSSGPFDSTHLVPLLYTAILCAVTDSPQKQSKLQIPLFENEVLKDRETLKMESGPKQYGWVLLSATVGQQIDRNNCYYMIDIIGMGSTSKLFYALHSSGKPCVIKMFVNQTIMGENGERLMKNGWKKVAKGKTIIEKENLENLYPSLKGEVRVEKILGFHCVVMPFFPPLKNNDERLDSENEIKQVLKRFHEKKLQYLDCDLRWRHIGRYKDEIILYDLADLISLGDDESNSDTFVNKCWKALQERLPLNT
jgi:Skp family chaperone for outer membrane proteins